MGDKKRLRQKIEEKEDQLARAERESAAWNRGKYKNTSNASMSKILVESLRNEIRDLKSKLESM